MVRTNERRQQLIELAGKRGRARLLRVQKLYWRGGEAPGMRRLNDEEFTAFGTMQRAEARRELEGRSTGDVAQRSIANPAVAREIDGSGDVGTPN